VDVDGKRGRELLWWMQPSEWFLAERAVFGNPPLNDVHHDRHRHADQAHFKTNYYRIYDQTAKTNFALRNDIGFGHGLIGFFAFYTKQSNYSVYHVPH